MTDDCSIKAIDELKASGKHKTDAEAVLIVFKWTGRPMTAREVLKTLTGEVAIGLNGVRSRITELTEAGFLKKTGKVIDIDSRCTVNAWEWTGQTGPLPVEQKYECCDKCGGKGKVRVMRPVDPAQGSFIK